MLRGPAPANLELIWGWQSDVSHIDVGTILNCADDVIWDKKAQRYRPIVDFDLLESFARLAKLTDEQVLA